MGRIIIKQPNGLYAEWSTIVDDFVCLDMTKNGIIEERLEDYRNEVEDIITEIINAIDRGECPKYYNKETYEKIAGLYEDIKNE
jgi:hypothetical protein